VTGATSGIGLAFAELLTAEGVDCVLLSNEADSLERVCAELSARNGGRAEPCCVDLRDRDLAEQVRGRVGEREVDLLINDASSGGLVRSCRTRSRSTTT
jgi:short-subunit dehydrogenase